MAQDDFNLSPFKTPSEKRVEVLKVLGKLVALAATPATCANIITADFAPGKVEYDGISPALEDVNRQLKISIATIDRLLKLLKPAE